MKALCHCSRPSTDAGRCVSCGLMVGAMLTPAERAARAAERDAERARIERDVGGNLDKRID